jgi:hypothetical protein
MSELRLASIRRNGYRMVQEQKSAGAVGAVVVESERA